MLSIGVITVATNIYVEYWNAMAKSFDQHMGKNYKVVFHVFTDREDSVLRREELINDSQINVHTVERLVWPEAALNFFQIAQDNMSNFNEDILINMDADMLINSEFDEQFAPESWQNGIALVLHPGFFKFSKTMKGLSKSKKRSLQFRQFILNRKHAGQERGSWESNPKSSAYVPAEKRKNYFCGAVWMGTKASFSKLISEISRQVEIDRIRGVTAVWLDESHLNAWASVAQFSILSPSYCYDPKTCNDFGFKNIIEAVEKGGNRTR